MQVGDYITLINELKQEVEVEVMQIYQGKDESSQKPSITADLKEIASGRMHCLVPSKQFVKGARMIHYYLDRPVKKPSQPVTPSQPATPPAQPETKPTPPPEPVAEPIIQTGTNSLDVTEEPTPAPVEETATIPQPSETVDTTKKTGQAKKIGVGDTIVSTDK